MPLDVDVRDPAIWELVPHDTTVEHLAGGLGFVEGPVWRDDYLLFSDIPYSRIVRWQMSSEGPQLNTFRLQGPSRAPWDGGSGDTDGLTLDDQDRLIVCGQTARTVVRIEPDDSQTMLADRYEGKRLNSPNDVVVHSSGAIYFSDPPYGLKNKTEGKELSFQGVFRISPEGNLSLLRDDCQSPNGLVFSPDEKLLYIGDSTRWHIRVFDVNADGSLSNGRVFIEVPMPNPRPREVGPPDGIKIDRAGNLYVGCLHRVWIYAPDGHLLGGIYVPENPTNLAWGDSDRQTLYIVARTGLYRVRLTAQGMPVGSAARR